MSTKNCRFFLFPTHPLSFSHIYFYRGYLRKILSPESEKSHETPSPLFLAGHVPLSGNRLFLYSLVGGNGLAAFPSRLFPALGLFPFIPCRLRISPYLRILRSVSRAGGRSAAPEALPRFGAVGNSYLFLPLSLSCLHRLYSAHPPRLFLRGFFRPAPHLPNLPYNRSHKGHRSRFLGRRRLNSSPCFFDTPPAVLYNKGI